jgi:hypothetical protein
VGIGSIPVVVGGIGTFVGSSGTPGSLVGGGGGGCSPSSVEPGGGGGGGGCVPVGMGNVPLVGMGVGQLTGGGENGGEEEGGGGGGGGRGGCVAVHSCSQ